MTHLPNAPVQYVLGVLRFPRASDPGKLVALTQEHIRDKYPISAEFAAPQIQVEMGPDGLRVEEQQLKFWQFSSLDKGWAVLIGSDMIALHTASYIDHDDFIRRFWEALEPAFADKVAGIQFVQALAMRYVDVIEPNEGETLDQYLVPSVLPSNINIAGAELDGGVMATSYRTSSGNLRLQVLRRPPTVLPPELMNPMTVSNNWGQSRPAGDFAVLDMDHGQGFEPLRASKEVDVKALMLNLHSKIRSIFDAAVTPHAMTVWKRDRA